MNRLALNDIEFFRHILLNKELITLDKKQKRMLLDWVDKETEKYLNDKSFAPLTHTLEEVKKIRNLKIYNVALEICVKMNRPTNRLT